MCTRSRSINLRYTEYTIRAACVRSGVSARSGSGGAHLALLGLVLAVLGEEVGDDVAAAGADVHHGPLLADAQARRVRQHQAEALDAQRPLAQVAVHHEARQHRLDLHAHAHTRARGRARAHKAQSECEETACVVTYNYYSPRRCPSRTRTAQTL